MTVAAARLLAWQNKRRLIIFMLVKRKSEKSEEGFLDVMKFKARKMPALSFLYHDRPLDTCHIENTSDRSAPRLLGKPADRTNRSARYALHEPFYRATSLFIIGIAADMVSATAYSPDHLKGRKG